MPSCDRQLRRFSLALALLGAGCADNPAVVPVRQAVRVVSQASAALPRTDVDAAVSVLSRDEAGRPRALRGLNTGPVATGDAEHRARTHLERIAFLWGARGSDVDSLAFESALPLGASGAALVRLRQSMGSVSWNDGELRVLLRGDGSLIAIRGVLRPDHRLVFTATLDESEAIRAASDVALGRRDDDARVHLDASADALGGRAFTLARRGHALASGRIRPVWFGRLDVPRAAYRIEMRMDGGSVEASRWIVDASDGAILRRESLVHDDVYDYRVFADPLTLLPEDAPTVDVSPYPGGIPDGRLPDFVAPSLVTIDGLPRPSGQTEPFIPGTVTTLAGNHAVAYVDRALPTGFGDGDLDVPTTSGHAFDYAYDSSLDALASDTQARSGAAHAFYVASYLHDWYYGSGFDELSGNAQTQNYGRGGIEGDAMRIETQNAADVGHRDNASMMAFSDGIAPVMQIDVWTLLRAPDVVATGLGALAAEDADYGPSEYMVSAELVLAEDGTGATTDACERLTNSVAGKIVLADRGTCTFERKTLRAQASGAVGVLIADDTVATLPIRLGDDPSLDGVTIPTASLTFDGGAMLKSALLTGAVEISISRAAGLLRDAALDTTLVAHEWGHYLHLRSMLCGTNQCAAVSEGMADFVALHLMLEEGDDLEGAFAIGAYAARFRTSTPGYFGVRRAPYSANPSRNALSFRHVASDVPLPTSHPLADVLPDNAEVHNAGEVWASMLWDGYVALVRDGGASFQASRRTMSDILVAGIALSPDDATYLESRDAIISAAEAIDASKTVLFAQAFAGRGAGTCAIGPGRGSVDFSGIVEDYEIGGRISLGEARLDIDAPSCDWDGFLDVGETAHVRVRVANPGLGPLTNVMLALSTDLANLEFPDGSTVVLAEVPPMSFVDVSVPVVLASGGSGNVLGSVTVAASAVASCGTTQQDTLSIRVDADSEEAASTSDDCESDRSAWFVIGDANRETWTFGDEPGNVRHWSAEGPSYVADRWLLTPTFTRDPSKPLRLSFAYRHDLEADASSGKLFDAVVLEVSTNAGASWTDVSTLAMLPYADGSTIATGSGNPLGGRAGFGGRSPSYPAWQHTTLDLRSLAGSTVRFRFRFVSNLGGASGPFDLDDITVDGIVETPFASVVADPGGCIAEPPDAGMPDAGLPSEVPTITGSLRGGAAWGCGIGGSGGAGPWLTGLGTLLVLVGARKRRR